MEVKNSYKESPFFTNEKLVSEFEKLFQQGPGCFVKQVLEISNFCETWCIKAHSFIHMGLAARNLFFKVCL